MLLVLLAAIVWTGRTVRTTGRTRANIITTAVMTRGGVSAAAAVMISGVITTGAGDFVVAAATAMALEVGEVAAGVAAAAVVVTEEDTIRTSTRRGAVDLDPAVEAVAAAATATATIIAAGISSEKVAAAEPGLMPTTTVAVVSGANRAGTAMRAAPAVGTSLRVRGAAAAKLRRPAAALVAVAIRTTMTELMCDKPTISSAVLLWLTLYEDCLSAPLCCAD